MEHPKSASSRDSGSNSPESTDPSGHSLSPQGPGSRVDPSQHWLSGPLGEHLLNLEELMVKQAFESVFGLQMLQIGVWGREDRFVQHSKTLRHSVVAPEDLPGVSVVAIPEELPIASDSVDAIFLPHILEHCEDPHQVLREAHRVLVGEGHVILLGFSPISMWGAREKSFPGLRLARHEQMLSEHRLHDWLGLLGLNLVTAQRYFYTPPINSEKIVARTAKLEQMGRRWLPFMNGAYMIVAKKSLMRAAVVGPRWHRRRSVVGGLAEPATRTADALASNPTERSSE